MEIVEILRYAIVLYLLCGLGVLVVGFVEMLKRNARASTVVAVFLLSPIVVGRLFRFMLAHVLRSFAAAVREVMNEMKQIVEG